MSDLLPCPFCGGGAETTLGPVRGKWGTRCKDCDVWRDDREATEADAIAAWNRRDLLSPSSVGASAGADPVVNDPRVKALIEAAEDAEMDLLQWVECGDDLSKINGTRLVIAKISAALRAIGGGNG